MENETEIVECRNMENLQNLIPYLNCSYCNWSELWDPIGFLPQMSSKQ